MKTANKKTAVNLSVVREPMAIDQLFQRSSLGYLIAPVSRQNDVSNITIDDAVGYVVSKLDAGQSAIRDAILFSAWVFKNKPEEQSKAYAEQLKARWSGSTIPNLISVSKALPLFENKGLSIDKVKDLYALREVSKLLKGEETSGKAVALLNEGKSPRAVKEAIDPKEKPVKEEKPTSAPAPVNIGEEADKLETLILTYVDRYAKLGEHEARLKLTRQIIAKMAIGNYTFLPSDAAAAVQTLKAKK
jgi:hypothetical protein